MYEFIEKYFPQIIIAIISLCIGVIFISSSGSSQKTIEIKSTSNFKKTSTEVLAFISTGILTETSSDFLFPNEIKVQETKRNSDNKDDTFIVKRVIDGDTIDIWFDHNIRILGIDAPESSTVRYGHAECDGVKASEYAKSILLWKQVRIEKDTIQPEKDIYNRYLLHIWIDDHLFSEQIVADGYAIKYMKALTMYDSIIAESEQSAKSRKVWLWWECPNFQN